MSGDPSALLGLYAQPDLTLVRGEGCRVWDDEGREYLDFMAGIAVTALGHAAPAVHEAIQAALANGLIHTSNVYRTRPAEELARLLVRQGVPGGVFFCNSGAEANEAALKFARRYAGAVHGDGRSDFLAFRGSFHGRLFGTVALTDRPAYREPFLPVMPGAHFADLDHLHEVQDRLGEGSFAAVIVEPVQGEGGVRPVPPEALRALRAACDATDTLLIFDEIQCGVGRTGTFYAHEPSGVRPDIVTLAKPLAGGLPMGAVVATPPVAETLKPGDHATTFGGGPLVATVARAVVETIADPGFLKRVQEAGARLRQGLEAVAARRVNVSGVRGVGLMQGMVVPGAAAALSSAARELGLLVVGAGPDVVRLVPPLVVADDEIDRAVAILDEAAGHTAGVV